MTPDGSLTFTQTGNRFVEDATGGQTYWRGPNGEIQSSAPQQTSAVKAIAGKPGRPLSAAERAAAEKGSLSLERQNAIINGTPGTPGSAASSPVSGWTQTKGYYIPQTTATQTLSAANQAIKTQDDAASLNLSTIANNQSNYLKDYLSQGINTSALPPRASLTGLQTSVPYSGGIQTQLGNTANGIQGQVGNTNAQIQSQLGNTAGSIQYGFDDAGAITKTYSTDFSQDRQRVEDALMARLNPSLERDRSSLQTQLSNQGIKLGSTAYDRGVDEFSRQSNDARLGAILNAGQEQSRLVGLEANRAAFENSAQQQNYSQLLGRADFNNSAQQQDFGQLVARGSFNNAAQQQEYGQLLSNGQFANAAQQQEFGQLLDRGNFGNNAQAQLYGQNLSSAGFTNQALGQQYAADNSNRDNALQEQFALRNQPINEISALLSGSQLGTPSFVNANQPTIPTVDYAGLVQQNYQNQMGAYQQQVASRNSMLGGLLGAAGTIGGAFIGSDERIKTDIKRIGTLDDGQPVYGFRYKAGGPYQIGLMAQDVEKTNPDAIIELGGVKYVDYERAVA